MLLTKYFIDEFKTQFGKNIDKIDDDARDFIINYSWPGNVRELGNAVERAVLLSEGNNITYKDISYNMKTHTPHNTPGAGESIYSPEQIKLNLNFTKTKMNSLAKIYAKEVLEKAKGNKSLTARLLGISRPKLDVLLDINHEK
jgi:DNA-binding NtrC family response regulator